MNSEIVAKGKINLLIITTYFPPIKSVASQRLLSFVKYLPADQYSIKVLTIGKYFDFRGQFPGIQNAEVIYIPNTQWLQLAQFETTSSFLVHKIKALYNRIILKMGINPHGKWAKKVTKAAEILHHNWPIDLILASYPAAEALQAGLDLAGKFKLPLVVDLRDGITNNDSNSISSKVLSQLERDVARGASLLVSVSKPILDYFSSMHPSYVNRYAEIRNGFDFDPPEHYTPNPVFTVTYAGKFYGERRPDLFFAAVENLLKQSLIENILIRLIGVPTNYHIPGFLESNLSMLPYTPYEETIMHLQQSDALLLILGKSSFKGVFSGKLFDYLGTHRTVIALCDPDDVAADLIKKCNAGFIAAPDNQHQIEVAIQNSYQLWKEGRLLSANKQLIGEHHRREQANRLHKAIHELISHAE